MLGVAPPSSFSCGEGVSFLAEGFYMTPSDEYQGLVIHDVYGNCPVQADGTVDGIPFYFRARGQRWRIGIGGNVVRDPAWGYGEPYGDSAFEAGWMTEQEAEFFIRKSFTLYRQGHPGNIETSAQPSDSTIANPREGAEE